MASTGPARSIGTPLMQINPRPTSSSRSLTQVRCPRTMNARPCPRIHPSPRSSRPGKVAPSTPSPWRNPLPMHGTSTMPWSPLGASHANRTLLPRVGHEDESPVRHREDPVVEQGRARSRVSGAMRTTVLRGDRRGDSDRVIPDASERWHRSLWHPCHRSSR